MDKQSHTFYLCSCILGKLELDRTDYLPIGVLPNMRTSSCSGVGAASSSGSSSGIVSAAKPVATDGPASADGLRNTQNTEVTSVH